MHFERCGELSRVEPNFSVLPNASRRGAYAEAQTHFDRALALLACEMARPRPIRLSWRFRSDGAQLSWPLGAGARLK